MRKIGAANYIPRTFLIIQCILKISYIPSSEKEALEQFFFQIC